MPYYIVYDKCCLNIFIEIIFQVTGYCITLLKFPFKLRQATLTHLKILDELSKKLIFIMKGLNLASFRTAGIYDWRIVTVVEAACLAGDPVRACNCVEISNPIVYTRTAELLRYSRSCFALCHL